MEPLSQQRPPVPGNLSQNQALPSIASLTHSLSPSEQSPVRLRQHSETRDSGNWSISQSKRKQYPSPSPDQQLSPATSSQSCLAHSNKITQTRRACQTTWVCNYRLFSTLKTRHHATRCLIRLLQLGTRPGSHRYISCLLHISISDADIDQCATLTQPGVR